MAGVRREITDFYKPSISLPKCFVCLKYFVSNDTRVFGLFFVHSDYHIPVGAMLWP